MTETAEELVPVKETGKRRSGLAGEREMQRPSNGTMMSIRHSRDRRLDQKDG